jgi:hypothetical protein
VWFDAGASLGTMLCPPSADKFCSLRGIITSHSLREHVRRRRTLEAPSGGLSPRTRFASTFAEGELLKLPPGDYSLMSASRPSPLTRTGNNGDNRIRTGDPLLAKQVLYQLSYVPSMIIGTNACRHQHLMVGQGGLEPPTPRLSSVCSNQLSY